VWGISHAAGEDRPGPTDAARQGLAATRRARTERSPRIRLFQTLCRARGRRINNSEHAWETPLEVGPKLG